MAGTRLLLLALEAILFPTPGNPHNHPPDGGRDWVTGAVFGVAALLLLWLAFTALSRIVREEIRG